MELLNTNRKSQVRSKFGPGRKDTGCTALARSRLPARQSHARLSANNHAAGRACNDRRIAFGPMHFFAAPARAPRRHGSDARASHPIRARRPGDRRPTLRSGIRNSYASTHAHVDVRHRRRFPGRLRREQDDERAPYYALFWTPPPATGFTWAVNGEFPTLRSQQTQISRKCAHFDARRYVRGSVRI